MAKKNIKEKSPVKEKPVKKKLPNKADLINPEKRNGRPREHDREAIGLEMIEWAKKETSINLNEFCCTREPPLPPCKVTQWSTEHGEFRKSYNAVKAFIAMRREKMLNENKLHVKAFDLNATTYDHFLRTERQQAAEHLSALSKDKDEAEALTPQQILSIKKIIDEN